MRAFAASPDHRVTLTVRSGATERVIWFDDGDTRVHEAPSPARPVHGVAGLCRASRLHRNRAVGYVGEVVATDAARSATLLPGNRSVPRPVFDVPR